MKVVNEIVEYCLVFKDNTNMSKEYDGEFFSEDKSETDKIFKENKKQVEQYYSKDWVKYNEDDEWKEDYVEMFYSIY